MIKVKEEWKEIEGYEEQYQISNLGRVRNIQTGVIRKTRTINSGYKIMKLKGRPNRHRELVHRLVAKAFCEGYAPGLEVNHIDGDRLNNRATNLEWVTTKENIHHNMARGVFNVTTAQRVAQKKNRKKVRCIETGRIFNSAKEASEWAGVRICRAASGSRKSAGGYTWEYI